jgi:branched-chain amino acid transport system ATP-binding protein
MIQAPALQMQGVTAAYGDVPALRGVDFVAEVGKVTAILGANGAGKTSLLRRLSGLSSPSGRGEIRLFGEVISGLRPDQIVARGLVQVPENRQIFTSLTIEENLEMGAHPKGARARRRESTELVFSLFPVLATRRKQVAGTLSGGEQQMVAIGRALMSVPRVLLLDEPSLGIAPAVVDLLFSTLADLRGQGLTLVLAEQNAVQALELANDAAVLSLGRVTMAGSKQDVLSDPEIHRAYFGLQAPVQH